MTAFSLLEVLIASALFFIAMFSVLALSSRSLNAARNLSPTHADISELVLPLVLTNRFTDEDLGVLSDGFENFPEHSWEREIVPWYTNGFFRVNFRIMRGGQIESESSIYMYKPASRITQTF
ncbi:MAG TPA: hypothetical protein VEH27_13225 [Methylomirabilota bacterium]|nr:hypothetical protein [Methylomirabilota bacterium]